MLHPQVNPYELINLVIALIAMPLVLRVSRIKTVPRTRAFVAGYLFWLLGLVATIAEGFILPDVLNFAEHLCYAASGIAFLTGALGVMRYAMAGTTERS